MPKLDQCKSNTTTGKRCKRPARGCSKFCKIHSKSTTKVIDLLKKLKKERLKGKYRCLTGVEREKLRKYYKKEVEKPDKITTFRDKSRNVIAIGYTRLVVGDHGAYFEFSEDQIQKEVQHK